MVSWGVVAVESPAIRKYPNHFGFAAFDRHQGCGARALLGCGDDDQRLRSQAVGVVKAQCLTAVADIYLHLGSRRLAVSQLVQPRPRPTAAPSGIDHEVGVELWQRVAVPAVRRSGPVTDAGYHPPVACCEQLLSGALLKQPDARVPQRARSDLVLEQ